MIVKPSDGLGRSGVTQARGVEPGRMSHDALAQLIEGSLDGVAVLDEALRVVYINAAGCDILGRPLEQLLGRTGLLAVSPERHQATRENLLQAMKGGQSRRSGKILRADGREREIEYTLVVVDAGSRPMVAGIFRDVTEARRSQRWAAALARIASDTAMAGSPEAILNALAQSVVETADVVACAAILFDGDPPQFRVAGAWGLPTDYAHRFEEALAEGLKLPAVDAVRSKQPVVVHQGRRDPVLARSHAGGDVAWTSIVCVPMVARGRSTGAIKIFAKVPAPDREMLELLAAIADQAAMAVDNAQLFAEARQSSRRQEALVQAGLALASDLSVPGVLRKIVELACEVTDAEYGALGLLGPDGVLGDFITAGASDTERAAIAELPLGKGLLGLMINQRRPLRLRSITEDGTSFLGVPITVRGTVYGHVYLTEKRNAPEFTEDDERAAVTLATQAGVAIQNARLFADAQERLALEERNRLARELHDSVSQALFSMTLQTRAAQLALEKHGPDPRAAVASRLARLRELTEGAHAEMRALIFELRPEAIREEGLVGAIRKHAAGIAARDDLPIHVDASEERIALPADVEKEMYRLTQEALTNVARHAEASQAWVRLYPPREESAELVIEVEDDGIGFDPSLPRPGHLGLNTMAERAVKLGGRLDISSTPQQGTLIRAAVPVATADRPSGEPESPPRERKR